MKQATRLLGKLSDKEREQMTRVKADCLADVYLYILSDRWLQDGKSEQKKHRGSEPHFRGD